MSEEWRPIPGFDGLYEASDEGFIRKVGKPPSRGTLAQGRFYVLMMKHPDGKWRTELVHRLILRTFAGEPPAGVSRSIFRNGDTLDTRASNLAWDERLDANFDGSRWMPIPGFDDRYEVSDTGLVREVIDGHGLLMKPVTNRAGYQAVGLKRAGETRSRPHYVHTLVLLAFTGPRPDGQPITRHLDGNPKNNDHSNLLYGTHAENTADMMRHGTNSAAKITHCPQGHEYTAENTKLDGGYRRCRICETSRRHARFIAHRDEINARRRELRRKTT